MDPKRSAFGSFGIVRTSGNRWCTQRASELLAGLIEEMERRYGLLDAAGVDNLAEYNAKESSPIPRIVCACDEYAICSRQQAPSKGSRIGSPDWEQRRARREST